MSWLSLNLLVYSTERFQLCIKPVWANSSSFVLALNITSQRWNRLYKYKIDFVLTVSLTVIIDMNKVNLKWLASWIQCQLLTHVGLNLKSILSGWFVWNLIEFIFTKLHERIENIFERHRWVKSILRDIIEYIICRKNCLIGVKHEKTIKKEKYIAKNAS